MNAPLPPGSMMPDLIPESAPFTPAQRAWLSGFLSGWLGLQDSPGAASPEAAPADADEGDFPWHDPTLEIDERLKLAEGRTLPRKLMAAMGQLDCGQCGYQCREYAEAIATGTETDITRCVPGGKPTQKVLKLLLAESGAAPAPATAATAPAVKRAPPPDAELGYHREVPVFGRLLSSSPLTASDSEKRVQHVVIDLADTGVIYQPGDSLGVWVRNNPEEVELVLGLLDAKGSEPVTLSDGTVASAREALSRECDLRVPTGSLYYTLARFARTAREAEVLNRLADDDAGAHRLGIHEVLNTLTRFPSARPPVAEFIASLGRLQPRLYSIASSVAAHPGQVHLTIAVVSYELYAREYRGVASNFFAERLAPGQRLALYVQKAHGFGLPADDKPVIMIGPGTGIAPFRAFLQERATRGAQGRNWLFFGNPHEHSDYLYREELTAWRDSGMLTRLDTAFSRDQKDKIYVQHRMREQGAMLWQWLEDGAAVYVCGDAMRMAADVDKALRDIVMVHGGHDEASAKAYLAGLAKQQRYQRDVY